MPPASTIGQSLPRVDGGEKAAGLTRFAADLVQPGMLHARLVLSHHAHARVLKVDARAARAVPGVVGVFTGRDLPLPHQDPSDRNRCPLALDRVRFVGHPVVAVVAESEAVAEDAAALVEVEYEILPAAVDALEAMRPEAPLVRERAGEGDDAELGQHGAAGGGSTLTEALPPNVASTQHFSRGDIVKGFAEAHVVIERTYRTSMVHQGYLEPRVAVASVDALGSVTVWTTTQALFYTRSEVAEALGLPEHQVRIVATPLGGGFGGKFVLLEPLAAALTVALKRPVSLVLTRTEEFLTTTPAPPSVFELKTGVAKDGRLTASDEGDLMANGNKWPRIGLRPCLERLKSERDQRKAAAPSQGRLRRGVGVALGGWLGGIEPANAVCRLERDGTMSIIVGTVDMSGTNTTFAQIASEAFGLDPGLIRVVNPDTEAAPYAGSSGGSKITYTVGAAVEKAARDAREQLFAIAAKHLDAAVEDL